MSKLPTTWNLKLLFTGDTDPALVKEQEQIRQQTEQFVNKWQEREDYLQDPAVLKLALDEYEAWASDAGIFKSAYYWGMREAQDQGDTKVKAEVNKLHDFAVEMINKIQFFELRVGKISADLQSKFINYPGLASYKHFLEKLFVQAKYQLSEPEERILNSKAKVARGNWIDMTQRFLSAEKRTVATESGKKEVGYNELLSLMNSMDKKARDGAAAALNDVVARHLDVAEVELNSVLEDQKINDKLRQRPRPDTSRHLSDDIEPEVVDVLIETVHNRFDLSRRFYQLKAKMLGQKKLAYHERNVEFPVGVQTYSYPKAVELVQSVFTELDSQFGEIMQMYATKGHIDVYPATGKHGGAFCAHQGNKLPVYILLNHNDKLNDVLTIAHEAGHGVNFELMRVQNSLNCSTSMATAEVASTFMEDFVLQRLLQDADDEQRLALLMSKLNDDISTIIRQVACYRFETELHQQFREKGYLSKQEIGQIFQKHMADYMGEAVEQSAGAENWWVYWGHIRSFFYVYSYASGLLISKSLQNSVKQNKQFVLQVKTFLSAGLSSSPKQIFSELGIDITSKDFWNKGLDEVEELLNEAEALAARLGKI